MKKPLPSEFELSPEGVMHIPTGANFRHIPGKRGAGIVTCKIPPDCEYEAEEIIKRMRKLWANRLKAKAPMVR